MRIRRGIYEFVTLLVTSRQSHGAIGRLKSIRVITLRRPSGDKRSDYVGLRLKAVNAGAVAVHVPCGVVGKVTVRSVPLTMFGR